MPELPPERVVSGWSEPAVAELSQPVSAAAAVNQGLVTHFVNDSPHPAVPGVQLLALSWCVPLEGAHLAHGVHSTSEQSSDAGTARFSVK